MRISVEGRPDFAMARVELGGGETIVAESGSMVAKTSAIDIETSTRGGILAAAKRSVLGGESFFINKFSTQSGGTVHLAPSAPGDVLHVPLAGELIVQQGSFLASASTIELDTKWAGVKGFFSGEGFFLLRVAGHGDLLLSSYGAMQEIAVDGDYIVDTGHIVAFEPTLSYKVERLGNWRATILSGEFLVCRFSGKGRLWIQSRAVQPFAAWVHPFRRVKQKSNE